MPKLVISLKARALRYLSMREHSRYELIQKLSRHATELDDVSALLDALEQSNWLSSERFSESLVHRRQSRFGNQRIMAELHSHGVEKEQIESLKQDLMQTETARARDVLQKKYPYPAQNQLERMKRMRFLQLRGFNGKSIQLALLYGNEDGDERS